ncbi:MULTISPECIES: serine hydrolase [unclassified Spirosoma]|uniref:serine hydrolase domain-containing protein n=1 Tax=unclassified Spirosoma TaxID=2621999 RepID=UPI0009640D8C|nr:MULTISPECIES: serine hydrolase domain-containing protein [unclassified Spirosoma]MBN8823297.1 beta-lactamase family protein [Spirosoma sp.]OJW72559.1 MAG: serine hydrolase [Spirosoma sp. 48-14]
MNVWLTSVLLLVTLVAEPVHPKRLPIVVRLPEKASTDNPLETYVDSLVERAAQQFMRMPQAVGLSIGIIKDGQPFMYNYGTIERGRHQLPTSQTVYPIASITKTFTGALLAQAVVDGNVKLDDDVRTYLTGDYPNLTYQGHPIRLFHLINHRSGLPFLLPNKPEAFSNTNTPASAVAMDLMRPYSRADFYADLHQVTLDTIPGVAFKYSNTGAQLLGYILERVYGQSFEQLIHQKLTRPLAMSDTKITLTPSAQTRVAKGYDCEGILMPDSPDELQAAGALKSTVADMLKYVQWTISEKSLTAKLTHQPTWTNGGQYASGLNWQMLQSAANRVIWQDGNIPGFSSLCANYPEQNLGIVVFANECDRTTASRIKAMTNQIIKQLDERAISLPN